MTNLKTELQKIQASPEQLERQYNYREILTESEIQQQLDYHMAREKKHTAYRMADSGLNPNRIAQKLSEIEWKFSDEAKEKILTEAAKRKIWHLEDLAAREKNRKAMEEKKQSIKAAWTADEYMRLIRTHYTAKQGKFIERPDQSKYFKALCYFLSDDVRFETELNYSFKKGLFITGESGVGKTETLKALKNNPVRSMAIISMIEVTAAVKSTGDFNIPENKLVVLDDVGCEPIPIKHYGTDVRWFADFIENKYLTQQNFSNLIITTNMGGEQIQELYGYRIRSRVREMFNVISVDGEDIRK
jgi:DNA replication protein DnaC